MNVDYIDVNGIKYANATRICKNYDKDIDNWLFCDGMMNFFIDIANELGINVSHLKITKVFPLPPEKYLHPKLIESLSLWIETQESTNSK